MDTRYGARETERRIERTMATMATRMALGPAPKAGLGRWSTRGRRARLEVRCRTAAEKRIEAKRNQKQSQSASRADLLAKSKKTAKSMDNADAQGKRADARERTRRSREDERKKSADNAAKSSDKGGERKDQTASNKSTSESTAPSQRPASTSRRSKGQRFERDFGFGEQGPHVKKLQRLLLAENYLSSGDQVTGYFGRDTKEALTQWQKANRVMPSGYFGPVSRAMVNKQGAVTRAKQQIAVNLRMNPVGTVAASFALAGALAAGIAYLARERQGVAVFDPNSDDTVGSEDFIGFGAVAVVQRAAGLLRSWIGPLLLFLQNRLGGTPLGDLGDQGALVSGYKESSGGGYQRGSTGEPSAGEEYTRRVELRRNIASLQNALGYAEDQLNSAKRQLKREKERADRAESLYLKQKATLTALEMENQKLKIELRPFRR